MIGTGEGYLVGLSMGIPLVFPLGYQNTASVIGFVFISLTDMVIYMSLGNNLRSLLNSFWNINWCGPWIGD